MHAEALNPSAKLRPSGQLVRLSDANGNENGVESYCNGSNPFGLDDADLLGWYSGKIYMLMIFECDSLLSQATIWELCVHHLFTVPFHQARHFPTKSKCGTTSGPTLNT